MNIYCTHGIITCWSSETGLSYSIEVEKLFSLFVKISINKAQAILVLNISLLSYFLLIPSHLNKDMRL